MTANAVFVAVCLLAAAYFFWLAFGKPAAMDPSTAHGKLLKQFKGLFILGGVMLVILAGLRFVLY